jgi:uncharacterized protein YyaL (SSP411 family)
VPNRLGEASSPYLLQHADNPVDWYEWGPEAFTAARRADRPVFLSVGYATCHWCHVMAHESFEDPATAAYLNSHFISVKVDREERPDVDRVYMDAVQAMTGQGGWPMSVFLTADGEPFLAGTYYPKTDRGHHPSFRRVLEAVVDAWSERRGELRDQARRLTAAVGARIPAAGAAPPADVLDRAIDAWVASFDPSHGGFGGAPKFPQAPNLELVVRLLAMGTFPARTAELRTMLTVTLDAMHAGGIYDHLAGGFARYATDRAWLVPHFEKMLYDNALLARLYLRAWQTTGIDRYRTVTIETLDYLVTDLADPDGGFHSGEDADAAGVEGSHAVWGWDELADVLGDEHEFAAFAYGATPQGNFEGSNVLHRPVALEVVAQRFGISYAQASDRLGSIRRTLLERRRRRVMPAVDDKVVTAWNGLALRAFAEAAGALPDDRWLDTTVRLATFMVERLATPDGGLLRSWRHGRPGPGGFCEDYAATALGLFATYQVTGERRWYDEAARLVASAVTRFADPDGGFFASEAGDATLIVRPRNLFDNPTPSDNSMMAEALATLHGYTGDASLLERFDGVVRSAGRLIEQHPTAVGQLMAVLASAPGTGRQVAVVGPRDARRPLERVVWSRYRPDVVLAVADQPDPAVPLLDGRTPPGEVAAFVCREMVCDLPVADPTALAGRLDG